MPTDLLTVLAKYGWPGLVAVGLWGIVRAVQAMLKLWREREDRHEGEIKRLNDLLLTEARRYEGIIERLNDSRMSMADEYADALFSVADKNNQLASKQIGDGVGNAK